MDQAIEFQQLKKLKFSISMQNLFKLTLNSANADSYLNSDAILSLSKIESDINKDNFNKYLSLFKTAFKNAKADHITYIKLKNTFQNIYDLLRCKIYGSEIRNLMDDYNLLQSIKLNENYGLKLVNILIVFSLATDKYQYN
ncbi:hypothetical protein LDVICp227 [lymphocystis disease virus-China]|uniref:Uncharacterized protein n=2 Tax=Lymphocystis disease virus 2 TaxID=159183 RepID=A0A6F8X1C6_9VIRU|nr:hypothetical protein LDVICp227 [lymphocystis disease virus-China]AAU11070.1 hypothetical protein [lymphocystis disease virus-China]BCB67545.1 hypothetical protein [Lymphocystis disease virus 2]